ncbi:glycosyltransferase family 2 protein [Cyclobacterium xiamenense]|uniref:glycosyltransferase family 2 protein n=1 Tax=Cyclobacterium xiamenense TaxID=1297121 RepID=UPI0012B8A18A|nr:glycosyltransferase family 2 protein [Cyclobacterium xiamenense]
MHSSIAIVLLNWNGWAFTRPCLESLRLSGFAMEHIIVVDNGSEDGSADEIQRSFPTVQLIRNPINTGFTGGNNAGIQAASAQGYAFVLLLNNDTEVSAGFWKPLLEEMDRYPDTGAVQPLIYFLHDKTKIWNAGGRYLSWLGISQTSYSLPGKAPYSTDWITGCAFLVRSAVLEEVGLLDERYFAYFEDVDWSLRIRKRGYRLKVVPESVIFHEAGAASKTKQPGKEGFLNPTIHYLNVRNQLFHLRKYGRHPVNWLSWPFHLIKFGLFMGYFTLRGRTAKRKAVLSGIIDGLKFSLNEAK